MKKNTTADGSMAKEVSRWIEENEKDMIFCPHQPGLLLISIRSCLKRYRAALERSFENISQENPFHYTLKKGLSLCSTCPIGKKLNTDARKSARAQHRKAAARKS